MNLIGKWNFTIKNTCYYIKFCSCIVFFQYWDRILILIFKTIIKSDWLTAPLKEGYFDAILGDLILGNIPPKYKNQLLKKRKLKENHVWQIVSDV